MHHSERDYHRYLVRGENGQLQDWRVPKLTFGVTSSPFLATQVLHQVASDHSDEFPMTTKITRSQIYMDDCLTGAYTLEATIDI